MKKHVLFICTGNLCRSPLAEGILKHKLTNKKADGIAVSSAGTFAVGGRPAPPDVVEVAARHGVDISRHRTRHITREMLAGAHIVLCMERDHLVEAGVVRADTTGKYRLLSEFGPPVTRGEEIEDPYGAPWDFLLSIYEQIDECVEGLLDELLRA